MNQDINNVNNQQQINNYNLNQPINNFSSQPINNLNNQTKKTNNLAILIFIVGLVVVIVAGVVLLTNNDNKKEEQEEKDTYKDENKNNNDNSNNEPDKSNINTKEIRCTFDGELVPGVEYTNGEYTYRYKQHVNIAGIFNDIPEWKEFEEDGWGVFHNNRSSSDVVKTELCTYINDKPIVSMKNMFYGSLATSVDTSSFNTKNVINMEAMFAVMIYAEKLDLSTFDTSNVKTMYFMFSNNNASNINVTSFDTKNVNDIDGMFYSTNVTVLDLSGFDTENLGYTNTIFNNSNIKTVYVRNEKDLEFFKSIKDNPEELEFVVKK